MTLKKTKKTENTQDGSAPMPSRPSDSHCAPHDGEKSRNDGEKTIPDDGIAPHSLQESEMIYEGMMEMSPFPVTISTLKEGRFLLVNDRFCELTGYQRHEIIGRTSFEIDLLLDPQDREKMIAQLNRTGKLEHFESRVKGKNAAPVHNEMSAKKIKYKGQDCLLVMTTHLRSLSRAQQALRQSENRFQTILNSIQESYYEVDLAGNFIFFNEAISTLFGRSPQELYGLNYRAVTLDEQEAEKLYQTFNEVYRTNSAVKFVEFAIKRKNDTITHVETSASILRDNDRNPIGFFGLLRDRTEQIKIETAIRQSEESYRSLLELAPDAITLVSIDDGRYLQVNASFCKLSGYTADETIGRTALELNLYVNPEDRDQMVERIRQEGQVQGMQIQFRTKSGQILETLTSAKQIPFQDRECLLVIVTDITHYNKIQEALHQSERKYRDVLETMEEGYYETDLRGNLTYFNDAITKIHGYSSDELMGMGYKQYLPPERAKKTAVLFNKVYRTDNSIKIIDYEIIRKDGSICLAELSAYPLKNKNGETTGFWGITRDRTEQKKAELALKKSEEQYRLLVENANDGIYITQKELIKFHNPKINAITGYTDEELAQMPFRQLVHSEDRETIYDIHQDKLKTQNNPGLTSFRILNKNQETIWVELNAITISWSGESAALNFLRDVTIQKKMESQLLQVQKMEAVGSLAGGIAHDFNNLLMGIKGNTALALMDIDETNPLYSCMISIEQYVKAGSDLTKQLLGTARAGKYETKPTDFNKLVNENVDLFGRTKKEISIHKTFSQALWTVEVDRSQMEQVLLNLFINAWHAMPSGGDLFLKTQNTHLDDLYVKPYGIPPGRYIKLSITDSGTGISPENIKRIFDPFFTTKAMGKGTGLGLASAYGIISKHGGAISVYSEPGTGATFTIYLPASEKNVDMQENIKNDLIKGSETILFVDDEPGIVEIALLILQRLGYTVISALDGRSAIEIYQQKHKEIEIVIVDMIMPGFSGGDTFDALKKINPDAKVILSSGYSLNTQAQEILNKGCSGFIQKPFSMQNLSAKLREVLG